MAFWHRSKPEPVIEAAPPAPLPVAPGTDSLYSRRGYDAGVPQGGATAQNSSNNAVSRRQEIDELYGLYEGCAPASTAIDAIARTITAGGIDVEPDDKHATLAATPAVMPPGAAALKALLGYVNPYDDIRQLLRNVIVDLLVTGDAFIEVTWLLGLPYALWNLDSGSMTPLTDEHGIVTGFTQDCGPGRTVNFEPNEIIHIKLDAPRGGVYGTSPTKKLRTVLLSYVWTAALLKETMRKGNPPRFHMRFPEAEDSSEIKRFRDGYPARHLGPLNLGTPVLSKGAEIQEFKTSAIAEYLTTLSDYRDITLSGYGVPGRKVGVAEPGSLGGAGAETGQDRTFEVNTTGPIAELVMEKVNFALLRAFKVIGWKMNFGQIDWRDDSVLETLRDLRLRNGSFTLNQYRREIGQPEVEGGDIAVLVDRTGVMAWSDLPALSSANVRAIQAKGIVPGESDPADPPTGGIPSLAPTVGKAAETLQIRYLAELKSRTRRVMAEVGAGHDHGDPDG